MTTRTRQTRIAAWIAADGECAVDDLARRLGVSGMTVRRDLAALANAGKVIRTHGGAAPAERVSFDFQFLSRMRENQPAKEAIAAIAAGLVGEGQSVMLDSGTTTLALARRLKDKRGLTVITTSLPIASELQFCENVQVLLLGGFVQRGAPDLAGALTESNLESLHADVAFIGADGIDTKGNAYNDSPAVGRMLGKMAAAADRVYVVADSSKLGRAALMRFGNVAMWDGLITDKNVDRTLALALKRARVRMISETRRARSQPARAGRTGRRTTGKERSK